MAAAEVPPFIAADGLLRPHVIGNRLEGSTQLRRCGVVDGFLFGAPLHKR